MTLPTASIDDNARDGDRSGGTSHRVGLETVLDWEFEKKLPIPTRAGAPRNERDTIDRLTGLETVRHLYRAIEEATELAERHDTPLSVVLIDVDNLKAYNESFGHRAGDDVLRSIAELLLSNVRAVDFVARHGGEEFTVVLPSSDARTALAAAEHIRKAIEATAWPLRPVTASFGVATLPPVGPRVPTLFARANRALSHSKSQGGNRVIHADALDVVS